MHSDSHDSPPEGEPPPQAGPPSQTGDVAPSKSGNVASSETGDVAPAELPTNVRWRMFALACGTSWFLYLHRYAWLFIGPAIKKEYELSQTQVQSLFVFFSPSYGIGQIPSGVVCDFFGPHVFLGVIIVLWSLILPLHGLSLGKLAVVRVLFGAAQAGTYPSLSKVTHTWFPQESRTIVQGWVATFFGRGGAAMSSIILATVLMGWCGLEWRAALLVMGGAGVVFGICFLIVFRNSPAQHADVNQAERALIASGRPPGQSHRAVLPWRRALKNRSMRFFVLQQIASAGADVVYVTLMGEYFLNARGFEIAEGQKL